MKWMTWAGASLGCVVMMGCAANSSARRSDSAVETNPQVTNVTPPPAPSVTPPAAAAEPGAPAPSETSTPVEPVAPAQGRTYTIHKGDTLYSIAKAHYGSGKAVNKILQANPGISPTHLKIGQVIVLP